ncbi:MULTISPECIES: sulfurtransferase TusA family protein [Thalassospira]|jgi:tRNA 2-thiouridine synthesizing protein A|uniref:Sulfurtransferase TusA family protein n=2 Tax=Thalassospira TaxID=168934 RepID=A0A8I1M891_9PROT|nr:MULTISPECIES: sulfurtransferase TusA family protein [Thalassospira]MEE3044826.1 sulfurtransferase TusA family protein [Pseudomonadota bacterium]RCK27181.1 preprotein translocase subunit TatC [Thalassospira profundimaris]KZB60327.1 preprotein translocase subunit TatC [Thalassospira sp. MCCC 1A02491]MBN8197057.1 sulfurtransferase TusA family protein [Thalassospira povalilytica]MBO6772428.1 sulfurtransferase TusA family protein [Thalassospira sp.]|tara:strand:- start:204 stop:455 length:252 start_codon:yes stop_codon:yes gene_type:complete
MSSSSSDKFDLILDARGLICPMPVLKAKKSLRDVPDGGVLKVLATDPGSVADMKSFCEMTGNRLISSDQEDDVFIYFIEKTVS